MKQEIQGPRNDKQGLGLESPMNSVTFLLLYAVSLTTTTMLVIHLDVNKGFVYLFTLPCVVAAFYYRRAFYITMLGLLAGAGIIVNINQTGELTTTLVRVIVSFVAGIAITETVHWLVNAYRGLASELRRERDFARNLIGTAQAIIVVLDTEGRVVDYNPFAENLIGRPVHAMVGENWIATFVPPEIRERTWQRFHEALEGISTRGAVAPLMTRHKGVRQIAWYDHPLEDAEGHITGLLSVGHDVTEQLATETALKEREAMYRSLVEHQAEGIGVVSPEDEVFTFANPAAHRIFGVPQGELAGRSLADFTSTEAFQTIRQQTACRREGEVTSYDVAIRRLDGEKRTLLVTAVPQFNAQGDVIETLGIFRDITERKRMETALRELNATLESQVAARTAALKAERDKTTAILQATGDAIAVVDAQKRRVQYVNPAFEDLTGYKQDEILGNPISGLIGPAHMPGWAIEEMRQVMRTQTPWSGELTLSRKNDEVYDAVVQVAPLPDAEGNARHYLVSHRDVTNLKALQRMQTQFVHNVSHELRTPVAILKLYAELLVSSPTGTGKRAAYEKAIYTTATHLSRLVHDILTLNTLDNRDIVKPEVEILQINTLICQDILQTCEALHDGDMPQIILKMEKPSPTIKANPWWLSQALLHILDNAMRYTPPDGAITLATARKTSQDGAWVTITVRDTGMGIAAEELPLIFNRFFRGHQVEELQVPGTGLGLAIAHEIVRMYSGHINVESTPHEGSTFTIWLPDASAAPSAS